MKNFEERTVTWIDVAIILVSVALVMTIMVKIF
jgi:uncharacterized membrane protein